MDGWIDVSMYGCIYLCMYVSMYVCMYVSMYVLSATRPLEISNI